jgi:hypothetical protein
MWQVYTRTLLAYQIFPIETAKFSKPKLKNWLKPVGGQIFELQFLFLKSSKIFICDKLMDICVKIIFFKILTTLDSTIILAQIIKIPILEFFLFFGLVYINFGGQQKMWKFRFLSFFAIFKKLFLQYSWVYRQIL